MVLFYFTCDQTVTDLETDFTLYCVWFVYEFVNGNHGDLYTITDEYNLIFYQSYYEFRKFFKILLSKKKH